MKINDYLCQLVKSIGSIPMRHVAQKGQTLYTVRTNRRKTCQ